MICHLKFSPIIERFESQAGELTFEADIIPPTSGSISHRCSTSSAYLDTKRLSSSFTCVYSKSTKVSDTPPGASYSSLLVIYSAIFGPNFSTVRHHPNSGIPMAQAIASILPKPMWLMRHWISFPISSSLCCLFPWSGTSSFRWRRRLESLSSSLQGPCTENPLFFFPSNFSNACKTRGNLKPTNPKP